MSFSKLNVVAVVGALLAASPAFSDEVKVRILEVSKSFAETLLKERPDAVKKLGAFSARAVQLRVNTDLVPWVSARYHETTGRCGGFIDVTEESPKMQKLALSATNAKGPLKSALAVKEWPELGEKDPAIVAALEQIAGKNIESFVKSYSAKFTTRKADTSEGEEAPKWLMNEWQKMAKELERTDVVVELMPAPKGYSQNSVRITVPGTDPTAPVVVLGAHLDSINSSFFGPNTAPGADDDASGIAAVTEIYRMLLKSGGKLKSTVEFFGYAAEEVGLLGSRVIAEDYSNKKRAVKAVMQLDMVAWPSDKKKVTFMRDYTDVGLTTWTEQLYGLYVGQEFQEEVCEYACSDHASWNRYGYKAVMPFESKFKEMNNRIHSEFDLWDDQLDAEYSALFARLGYAFAVTLAR